ncbi:MAG: HAD hydrolase family protein [Thermoprotei archaeon]
MDQLLVALDLDGTIKPQRGPVDSVVLEQIERLRTRGLMFVLVTGRCLGEVESMLPTRVFDALVVENGAILVFRGVKIVMCPNWWLAKRSTLPPSLLSGCEEVIVSFDASMFVEAQRWASTMGGCLERNKDRLMLLPPGVNKASGLRNVLDMLHIKTEQTMCIGDGENDLPIFDICGVRVALKNSVPELKRKASYVSAEEDGKGVVEALTHYFG